MGKNEIIKSTMFRILFICVFIGLAVLQFHNTSLYPAEKGFDASGHIRYINIIKYENRLPLANEGWETYQPPLYYVIASLFPNERVVQMMNNFTWIGFGILAFIFIKKYSKNEILALLAAVLIGSLPMLLYTTPMISNELFSGLMISISLVYYLLCFKNKKEQSTKEDMILGLLLGLSLLSKATSVILILAIIVDTCIDKQWKLKEIFSAIYKVLGIVFIVSGWFYIRNIIHFGNPLVLNTDFPGNEIHQLPGYRDWHFFLDPKGFLTLDIFHGHYYSLWAGLFYSWFFDGHNALIPVQEYSRIGVRLVLCSFPLFFVGIFGMYKTLKHVTKENRLLFIYPILLILFFIVYSVKFPFYSTVKAIYLVSLVIPWIYFVISGLKPFVKSKLFIIFFGIYLFIYIRYIFENFWIIKWWYDYMK